MEREDNEASRQDNTPFRYVPSSLSFLATFRCAAMQTSDKNGRKEGGRWSISYLEIVK